MGAHPARTVENNILISPESPEIKIKVSDDFAYFGSLQITLYGIATADVFIFTEATGKRVHRYLIIQFESYLPTNDYTYNYKPHDLVRLGDHDYIHDTFVGPFSDDIENPESDSAQTVGYIEARDFHLPDEIITTRFVRLLRTDRRSEILFGYNEDLGTLGYKAADISEDSRPKLDYSHLADSQLQRALSAFEVVEG